MSISSVFVTGITGFVGSHLADYILAHHPQVKLIGFCRWRSPIQNISHIRNQIHFHYGDLSDAQSVYNALRQEKPDVIFHLAAQSYVDFSFVAPSETLATNVQGTCHLLESIKILKDQEGYDPIIHICSSSEVYGQVTEAELPITENQPFRPASPYAVSKVGEDMLAYQYWQSWGLKTIRTRMFTHTGPRRGDVFVLSTFSKQIAGIEKKQADPVIKVGNLNSIRTFADVRDAVHAYWLLVNHCKPGEAYNIGGNETMSVGDMLDRLLASATVKNIRVEVDPNRLRPSDVTLQIPAVDKFKSETQWEPKIPFSQTLTDTLDYWRARV